ANAIVRCVAGAIVNEVQGGPRSWEVAVFQDGSANAFALPGGKIGVNTGMFKVARNPDQLAAVIGHEVGHVLAQHSNERLSQQFAVQAGLSLADAVAGQYAALPREQLLGVLGLGAQLGILLPYSRTHESEADVIGLNLMARAGFDPRQSIGLWQNMARSGGGQPPEFMSTHPSHGTRLQDLQAAMGPALQTYERALAQGKRPRCG
ncbi:MAG: M48 family metallopeptidase, partial [Pseudomonadota bacterium]|nr:M48 family metallopeptidase [Pseudomonadota bacterium]